MKSSSSNEALKQSVGCSAAGLLADGMVCGIGTGSTARFFIEEVGRRMKDEGLRIIGVPTSFQSRILCQQVGIPLMDAQDCRGIDLAVDGADEVDPELNVIKGGGAAHTIEKLVATMAREFVVIVDESKLVAKLGSTIAVPIEIILPALGYVTEIVTRLGGVPKLRMGVKKDGPVVTDNGHVVLDAKFDPEADLRAVNARLKGTPGVLETGLFFDLAKKVLVGVSAGMQVQTLTRKT
ncbi:MAG TPA: ribose-5-phosphate isomerase RpiA [Polyangia bacterium]